jgi:hypothetical protein
MDKNDSLANNPKVSAFIKTSTKLVECQEAQGLSRDNNWDVMVIQPLQQVFCGGVGWGWKQQDDILGKAYFC